MGDLNTQLKNNNITTDIKVDNKFQCMVSCICFIFSIIYLIAFTYSTQILSLIPEDETLLLEICRVQFFVLSKVDFLLRFSSYKFDINVRGLCLIVLSRDYFFHMQCWNILGFLLCLVNCYLRLSQLMNRHWVWRQLWALLF